MTASPDNWIVREGRDPEGELTSLQKRFAAITRRFEHTARLNRLFKALRADALAACMLFAVAFAVMAFGPPIDTIKHAVAAFTENWTTPQTSSPEDSLPQVSSSDEPDVESEGGEVHYRNCAAAYAAGAAPIYIGQPGYESRMDGDGDGIACEPRRRSRRR